ncbi:DUF1385 domain-containing protein [Polycladospora coralii]|uniref:DUF1385 domain-containing protein n=1 Tax=Polycladospora coralii TaxID=2771432 RepID=UPI001745C7BE|nr:DUF1385 domain-containing protein [Polycladospora coralii]
MSNQSKIFGGQAVIEGVMFGGNHSQVTAVRRKDGQIETYELQKASYPWIQMLKKIPLLRGLTALIESSAYGAKHMQFASDQYELDHIEEGEKPQAESKLQMILGVAIVGILSLIAGKVIFTGVPAALAHLILGTNVQSFFIQSLVEGVIKTLLLFTYLWAISLTPLIKRVFQYHGAEHKVITAYENREELTVENIQRQSRLHYRCGSSFIILSVIVGVVLYSFFPFDNIWERLTNRILLIPVVIGLSYEVLRATNAMRDIPVLKWLGYPGLWLQKLTTKEPTPAQIEVAIVSFNRLLELEATSPSAVNNKQKPVVESF